ncbi:substrate-binding domain-containing protein [Bdellovibrio bacteriovorus]|uniref:Putative ribose ABC transporter n=1 Tax=Bdellovibrio bacteriovorus str. Tiberius TaxID=1069642 RepID=K7Z966_BDEBC|nr:substrate-binding domain-containing protein [Bdellovibrio bacteriovorus]AFY01054.1 putative ribose ABC transporter [Bdellovibrio bacteriovorus str. Tiberius]
MNKLALSFFVFLILTAGVSQARTYNVAVLYWSMKIPGQVAMREGFEEEVTAYNKANEENKIKLTPYVAGEGREGLLKQIEQLDLAVKSAPDAIVIQPADITILSRGVQDANSKNIPVFVYDQYIINAKMTSYISSDNYQAGWDNGLYIDSQFPPDKVLRIVPFEYFRVSATVERMDGFFDALRSRDRKFTVLGHFEAVEPVGGLKAAQEYMKKFKRGSVDVIFTNNDGGGLIIVKTLWDDGRKKLIHATVDGDPASIENIKNKKMTVIDSAQFCGELGRETARTMIQFFQNGKVEPVKFIPTFPVTLETLKNYPGWMGRPTEKVRFQSLRDLHIKEAKPGKLKRGAVIKVGLTPSCPYLCEMGPAGWSGYLYDILESAAKANNLKFEIVKLPSEKLLSALQNQQVHFVISPISKVRYTPDVRIVGPKLGMSLAGALFTPGVKLQLVDSDSLADKRIVFAQLAHENPMQLPPSDFNRSLKISGGEIGDRMTKLIAERRVDLALGDYNVLRYNMLRRQLLSFEIQPTSLAGYNALVLVGHPKDPEYGGLPLILNQWFDTHRASGKLEKILKKYNLKDWNIFAL